MAATATLYSTDSDTDRLAQMLSDDAWHSSAPGKLRRMAGQDSNALWKAWRKHLERRDVAPTCSLVPGKKSALGWTLDSNTSRQTADLVELLTRASAGRRKAIAEASEQLPAWLAENEDAAPTRLLALESLAWCQALPALASVTSAEVWCELLERLFSLADDSAALDENANAAVAQLLRSELPLTLAYLLPELKRARRLGKQARDFLSTSILEMLDGEGVLHGRYREVARDLLACWTRCRSLGEHLKSAKLSSEADKQYSWFVTSAMRQCRHDGSQTLTSGESGQWSAPLFEAALELDGDEADEEVADVSLPGRTGGYEPEEEWPDAANDSEWAGFATLRSDWARSANHVSVAYDRLPLACELNIGKQTIFTGDWEFEIKLDGKRITPPKDAEWDQVCWESDRDCDYLELELDLGKEVKLQRSFLLAHEDEFLVVADTILGTFAKQVEYRGRLPLFGGVDVATDKKNTELTVGLGEPSFRVLPLNLSEWKSDSHRGALQVVDGHLELKQQLNGSSMAAPLFFDLSKRRRKSPLTWRQLSVGEERQVVPPDVAAGYRVEIGKSQWLFYRSLAPRANRTVLGQNINCEILAARFYQDGSVDELLEIE